MHVSLSRDSWVMRLARFGFLDHDDRADLCSVFWHCVWGLLWPALVIVVGSGAALVLVLYPLLALFVGVVDEAWYFHPLLIAPAALYGVFGILFFVEWLKRGDTPEPVRDAIVAGYRGWKQKTCVMVDVV